ncbi:hypothetical protein [Bradyrhizobium sp. Cp5.3]|uniref:hypothetical protein n=1 Tax=Bradyrhizobium sp. Cp5.3 TaxID=443598 RepID=UPI000412A8F8|nr:hypothetical protein [Bradyrhizobium sp. Cp5.3]
MLKEFVQASESLIYNDATMYSVAAVGLCAFVGLYYLGDYLFCDREPEGSAASETGDGI